MKKIMPRNIVAIILTLIFVAFLTAPAVIGLIDDSIEISMFYTSSPEEDKGVEKNKDIEVLFSSLLMSNLDSSSKEKENNSG